MTADNNLTPTDTDRLVLLDRLAVRLPEFDLDQQRTNGADRVRGICELVSLL